MDKGSGRGEAAPDIELDDRPSPGVSALTIAMAYAAFGGLWILASDLVVGWMASSADQLTVLQTAKGWLFILISSAIIYGLVLDSHRRLTRSNRDLETAIHQVSILHRILRHNLRNICSIIGGAVYGLEHDADGREEYLALLRDQNDRLESLSRKSHHLREFLTDDAAPAWVYDLAETVTSTVEDATDRYPEAQIYTDVPSEAPVRAHHLVGEAVAELLENAVEHHDADSPAVWVSIDRDETWTSLVVEDNGPGIPASEQTVLRQRYETAMEHSQGLGLWLVRLTVEASDGTLAIESSEHGGSRIRLRLHTASL